MQYVEQTFCLYGGHNSIIKLDRGHPILNTQRYKKSCSLDKKNVDFKKLKTCIFPKGLVHGFGQKIEFFFIFFCILCQTGQENVTDDILHRKKSF